MDESQNLISKAEAEAEIKTAGVNEVIDNAAKKISEPVEATVDSSSVVKPLVEQVTQTAKSAIDNAAESSYVTKLEKEVQKFASDPVASLKNLGASLLKKTPESSSTVAEEPVLPTSDKNVGESSETDKLLSERSVESADVDEKPRASHTQPFVAVSAGSRASWMNCCGLLDVLGRSDH